MRCQHLIQGSGQRPWVQTPQAWPGRLSRLQTLGRTQHVSSAPYPSTIQEEVAGQIL